MNKLILLASVCLTSIMSLKAQSLKGVLQDVSDQSPFPGATVILKDSLTKALSSVTHKQGSFTFQKIPMGKYTLSFSSVGYDAYENIISVTDTGNIDLGIISIAKSSKILSTVVVNATAPPVKQKADTLEYAANGFKVNSDANAEDLLKKSRGSLLIKVP